MMAYRSAEHETTSFTPNELMIGREVSTPLDLMYGMPNSVKVIPSNEWAWELKERLEEAHKLVRKNTDCSMKRQKKYHDVKNSWEQFDVGQLVYVFFPVKKVGTSGKFTSYWKGPFQVVGKMSDVLYSIDCGRNGSNQVIHCNRIRRCPQQVLKGEQGKHEYAVSDATNSKPDKDHSSEGVNDVPENNVNKDFQRFGRKTKLPVWMQDYVQ